MKRITNILAVITLATAMSFHFISCTKENPLPSRETEETTAGKESQKLQINFDCGNTLYSYIGEPSRVEFTVTGDELASTAVKFSSDKKCILSETGYSPKTGKGYFVFSLNEAASHSTSNITLTLTGEGNKIEYHKLTVTAYYLDMKAEDIVLSGNKGENATIEYTVNTNIPDFVPEISTEIDWISIEGNTVKTISENATGNMRKGEILLSDKDNHFDALAISVSQETLEPQPVPGCVTFAEWPFKKACLAVADTDKDGEISFAEAESVQELEIVGKGIKDLTGLEAFKNIWKLDARNNDIEDADILKELHYLHWLDLQGNDKLRTFDLTGCTIYFDHCKYATPEGLHYTVLRRQVGVSGGQEYGFNSDPYCKYSKHVRDERVTTDWSRQDELVLIKPHTKTWKKDGKEMSYAICLTGMGYIDVDINDGSLDRLMRDSAEKLPICGDLKDKWEYFDVYYMSHIMDSRFKYQFPKEEFHEETGKALREAGKKEQKEIHETAYKKIFNDDDSGTKKLIDIFLCLTNFPNQYGIQGFFGSLPCYFNENSSYKKCMRNAYAQDRTFSGYLEEDSEWVFLQDMNPQMNLFDGMEDDINTILADIF